VRQKFIRFIPAFLASDDAAYITAQVFVIHGGETAGVLAIRQLPADQTQLFSYQ